ncbi:MAG TPA: efflux RND transporter periplasmic adaptor subunit [Vicinamibacterales bacterium]|nr:efflux RND transporter periplasmic adaptor subunit [Vicinamibacterales bacterium]
MSRRKKILIGVAIVLVGAAVVGANFYFKKKDGIVVTAEAVRARDLEAIVSASGKLQAKRFVNMSAVQMGRVTRLAVEEGDRVKAGQFLLQIDPNILRGSVQRGEAAVAGARSGLEQARVGVATAEANLTLARDQAKRQRELWKEGLTTREALDQAESLLAVRETELQAAQSEVQSRQHMIQQESASLSTSRYNLDQVTLSAPFDGIVTRRNIEEGENVVVGTMNNAGTQLLTVADMSIVEAELEVDETEIPSVKIGQRAKVTIDAISGETFPGKVTEIGNSPLQTAAEAQAGQQATNFKVVVTLDKAPEAVRPGFTCSAEITTGTRTQAVAVPIQAMAVRELVYDKAGKIVRPPKDDKKKRSSSPEPTVSAAELEPGQTRKEVEGAFLMRNGIATFVPVKTGIAGDKYFEVLSGLKAGDQVITGPYNNVRNIKDGDTVRLEEKKDNK